MGRRTNGFFYQWVFGGNGSSDLFQWVFGPMQWQWVCGPMRAMGLCTSIGNANGSLDQYNHNANAGSSDEWAVGPHDGSGYVAEHFRSSNFAFPQVLYLGLELGLVLGLGLGLGSGLGFSLGLVLYVLGFLALHYFLRLSFSTFQCKMLGYVTSSFSDSSIQQLPIK